jgi:hypothetical protein
MTQNKLFSCEKAIILSESLIFNFFVHGTFRAYSQQTNFQKKLGLKIYLGQDLNPNADVFKSVLDPVKNRSDPQLSLRVGTFSRKSL